MSARTAIRAGLNCILVPTRAPVPPDLFPVHRCLDQLERIEAMLQQPAHTFTSPDELLRLATSVW